MKNFAILAILAAMTAFGAVVVACGGDAKSPSNDPGAAGSSTATAAPSAS
jgi:hypothetical protein